MFIRISKDAFNPVVIKMNVLLTHRFYGYDVLFGVDSKNPSDYYLAVHVLKFPRGVGVFVGCSLDEFKKHTETITAKSNGLSYNSHESVTSVESNSTVLLRSEPNSGMLFSGYSSKSLPPHETAEFSIDGWSHWEIFTEQLYFYCKEQSIPPQTFVMDDYDHAMGIV